MKTTFDTRFMVGEEYSLPKDHPVGRFKFTDSHQHHTEALKWLKRHRKPIRSRADVRVRFTNGFCNEVEKITVLSYDYKMDEIRRFDQQHCRR